MHAGWDLRRVADSHRAINDWYRITFAHHDRHNRHDRVAHRNGDVVAGRYGGEPDGIARGNGDRARG